MELTILLAKVFGLYMIVISLAIFLNHRSVLFAIFAMAKERFAQLMAGIISLLLGLFLVNIHNDWSTPIASIVSLVGWSVLLKGCLYLFLPEAKLAKLVHGLSERNWFMVDGGLALVVGLYLAGYGFHWF